eukprot:scaffold492_cov99-Amphora_coffeaeformis.AAC.2
MFPTPPFTRNGVEAGSSINRYYALRSDEQARAFLQYPETDGVHLRTNYVTFIQAVTEQLVSGNVTPVELVGPLDVSKLKSSVKYFEYVAGQVMDPPDEKVQQVCLRALQAIEEGEK